MALAFAVASSGNLPVVVLSLFWRKMNTAGVVAGLLIGTITAIGLVMISPNMTYPQVLANNAQKTVITSYSIHYTKLYERKFAGVHIRHT